jgi:hypothetical protein
MRILQTDASLWKEEKTLSYCQDPNVWDSVWTGPLSDGSFPTYLLSETYSHEYTRLLVLTGAPVQKPNVLHLPTIGDQFPHLDAWDGTTEHAVILLAQLLRYRKIYNPSGSSGYSGTVPGTIPVTQDPPRPLFLLTTKEPPMKNPLITKVILLPRNPTFADVFRIMQTLPRSFVVFTRPGIVLDDWKDLWAIPMKKTLLAVLSHTGDNFDDPQTLPIANSQDAWVMRSEDAPLSPHFTIPIDRTGSESAFAYRMLQEKFLVVNPARSLITWARDPVKTTSPVESPVYHFIHPTGINDMKPVITWSTKKQSFVRVVKGDDAPRFLHMLSKQGISLSLGSSEYTVTIQDPLSLTHCFQTLSGLTFDSNTMYIGNGKGAQEAWSKESLYALLPTHCVPFGYSVAFPESLCREDCILYVVSKLLLLQDVCEGGSYVCPPDYSHIFDAFRLHARLPYTPDSYIFYSKALCYPVDRELSPQMVDRLRKSVGWIESIQGASIVCMVPLDTEPLRRAWDVRVIDPDTLSLNELIAQLSGAWGVVCGESYGWNWILPRGSHVFQLSASDTRAHHLSTIAGLNHTFTTADKVLESIADTP